MDLYDTDKNHRNAFGMLEDRAQQFETRQACAHTRLRFEVGDILVVCQDCRTHWGVLDAESLVNRHHECSRRYKPRDGEFVLQPLGAEGK